MSGHGGRWFNLNRNCSAGRSVTHSSLSAALHLRQPLLGSRHLHLRQEAAPPTGRIQQHAGTAHQRAPVEVRASAEALLCMNENVSLAVTFSAVKKLF